MTLSAWEAFICFFFKDRRILHRIPHGDVCQGKGRKFSSPFSPMPQDLHRRGHRKNFLGILTDLSPHTLFPVGSFCTHFPTVYFFVCFKLSQERVFLTVVAVTPHTGWTQLREDMSLRACEKPSL